MVDRDRTAGLVALAPGDDPLGVGDHAAVVEEHVDMVPGGQQRADIAIENEVRLDGALDRLLDLGVGRVDEVADLLADRLLPRGQSVDVGVDSGVPGVRHLDT